MRKTYQHWYFIAYSLDEEEEVTLTAVGSIHQHGVKRNNDVLHGRISRALNNGQVVLSVPR